MNTNITDNKNSLHAGNFRITIDTSEYANIQFFATGINIPSMTVPAVEASFRNNKAFIPGDTIQYGEMTISFIVDAEMTNYKEIYDWLMSHSTGAPKYRDITVSVLSNKNTTNRIFSFKDCFPISLGDIEFTSSKTDVEYVMCSANFAYNRFSMN